MIDLFPGLNICMRKALQLLYKIDPFHQLADSIHVQIFHNQAFLSIHHYQIHICHPHLHPIKCQSSQEAITYALNSPDNIGIILLTHLMAPNAWRPLVLIFWDILKEVSLGVGAYP